MILTNMPVHILSITYCAWDNEDAYFTKGIYLSREDAEKAGKRWLFKHGGVDGDYIIEKEYLKGKLNV